MYEAAVNGFGMDCQWVLAEHSTWVDCETIANLACESEATHARAAEDKKCHEVEEEKKCWETVEHPREWGQVDTAGSTIAESLTLRVKKVLWLCTYCTKQGELFFFTSYFCFLSSLCRAPMQSAHRW